MLYPTLSSLLDKTDSRYSLVLAVAKRARQLSEDSDESFTDYKLQCDKPVSLAVHEISEGSVDIVPYNETDGE